jgi:nucleotide-binding universal stress UspA family protein
MTFFPILIGVIIIATVMLWATLVYMAIREMKTEMPGEAFAPALDAQLPEPPAPMKVLLPIDGSQASVAAVQEVAHCPLPPGSTVELLYAIHSRLPVIPDFPPWAVTIAATHGESIRAQTQHAPEVLAAAAKYLQTHQRQAAVVTKTVEGVPKDEIVREAAAWRADRIILGSHGRGHVDRMILGSTAAAVAAEAPCTVHIARPRPAAARAMPSANVADPKEKPPYVPRCRETAADPTIFGPVPSVVCARALASAMFL